MRRYDIQASLIRVLRLLNVVHLLVAAAQRHQRLAHVLARIRMTSVQLEGRLEIVDGLLERAAVRVQRSASHQTLHVARINAERLVQTLKRFGVAALLEMLDAIGNGSENTTPGMSQ